MGIYIKGMKMPKKCLDCIWLQRDKPAGLVYCTATDPWLDISFVLIGRKHDDCPIVEVPAPHGRLIDADELGKSFLAMLPFEQSTDASMTEDHSAWIAAECDTVNNEPTVIPAEEKP